MKTKLFVLAVLLAIGGSLHAQGVRFGDTPQVTTVLTPGGVIYSVANASISFCVSPANQVPCTNKVTTYTSGTLATACPTSTQIVLATTNTCVGKTDNFGNWGVWVPTGTYDYTITLPNGASVGPYTVTLASGGGGGGGANTALSNLSAVAINADLLPAATQTRSLGSASDLWLNAFLQNLTIGGSIVFTSVSPIIWTGPEGSCSGAVSGKDVLCLGDLTTHQILESDNGGSFNPLAKGTGVFTPGNFVSTSSVNPLLLQDSGISAGAVGGPPVGPAPVYDVQNTLYHAIPYASAIASESTTATGTGGTGSLTLAAAKHFVNNEGIVAYAAGAATTQSTPGAPTIAVPSVTGSTTFHYQCVGIDALGGLTAAGSSTTTSTAPLIFGAPQVTITAISLTSNVVSVSATGINAVSGQYVSVSGVTGAGSTWNGFWKVATGGANSFTYALTSANGTGTVGASTFAQLTNTRGITALSRSTSGVITVTTDGNHNFTASGTNNPTLAIINGASPADFNGTYAVLTASTNTMTLQSAISPAATEIGSVTLGSTIVTVWEQIIVTCPAVSAPTVNYAVYGDSPNGGSTITYLGETMYGQRTFVDWGPFLAGSPQKRGYVPTLPPGAAQAQLYVGKIVTGGGTTAITVTPNITTNITSQGFLHDESQGILATLNAASANGGGTAYLSPSSAAGSTCAYAINYPITMPTKVGMYLGCEIVGNEPVTAPGYNKVFFNDSLSSSNVANFVQFSRHHYAQWTGSSKELLVGDIGTTVEGIDFLTSVNGQNLLVIKGSGGGYSSVSSSFFQATAATGSTDIGITYIAGSGGNSAHYLHDIGSLLYSALGTGNSPTGIMPMTPPQIPGIWIRATDDGSGAQPGQFVLDGQNEINGRGIMYDETYCSTCSASKFRFNNNWDQAATTPFFMTYGTDGGLTVTDTLISEIQMDTTQSPCLGDWARMQGPTVVDNCTVGASGVSQVTGNVTPQLSVYGLQLLGSVGQNSQAVIFPSAGTGQSWAVDSSGNVTANSFNGTNAVGGGAAPVMAYYFGPNCPATNTVQCFFTPANTQVANDCTWASSGPTVTCASSHFVSGDVGKRVMGFFKTDSFGSIFGCVAGRISFSSMTTGVLTISGFTSGTSITLSGNPANTATGNNGCFIWGTPDDANAVTFETAYDAVSSFCPKIMLAAAGYWFSSPHFATQPTGCSALPSIVGAPSFGNMVYTAGFEMEGRGPGNTVIYLGPDFPAAGGNLCTNTVGNITNACFVVPTEGKWSDFQISGGAQLTCQVPTSSNLIGVAVGTMQNITLTNMCLTSTGKQIGIKADLLSQLYQVNSSGWGTICLQTVANDSFVQAYKLACENSQGDSSLGHAVDILGDNGSNPTFTCWGCLLLGAISKNNMQVVSVGSGATVRLNGGLVEDCEDGAGCVLTGGVNLILNSGGKVFLDGVTMAAVSSAVSGINNNTSGSIAYVRDTVLAAGGSGNAYVGAASTTLVDEGGNTNLFLTPSIAGVVQADGRSVLFSCTGTANASVTNSLYGTGPNVTATTCAGQTSTLGAGIPFQQARTISAVICTSSATTVSVACTVMVNGSASSTTCTMTAATRCTNFTATAVNPGDLLSAKIVTGAAETGANIKMQVIWQ